MSSFKITSSSELITNYLQAETVAPYAKFQALQTPDGHSLLFSIGTDAVFYLTEEFPGQKTGWVKNDISWNAAAKFPTATSIRVKTFAADQNQTTNGFSLLMALTVDEKDHLFMANAYSRDADNAIELNWVEIPFDNPTPLTVPLRISDIYVMDTPTEPLIIVDVAGNDGDVARYYIDTKRKYQAYSWIYYSLPVDMNPNTAQTPVKVCSGRRKGEQYVNGLYTKGVVAGSPTIVYQPLYSVSNPSQPGAVSNLLLPEGVFPVDIVTVDSVGTPPVGGSYPATFTDLFATGTDGGLYFFSADNQSHRSTGENIMTHELFLDVKQLFAIRTDEKVTIFACNENQEVFYTQCYIQDRAFVGEWSYPLPIATNVQQISPYLNRVNGGNTYFAHIGLDTFKKVFKDPGTSVWQTQDVLLPTLSNENPKAFDSYTTKVTINDSETQAPVANAPMLVSSAYRIPTYINNHYYVLSPNPVSIVSDSNGSVTIIQPVDTDMQGACLSIQAEVGGLGVGSPWIINPMDNATAKMLDISTPAELSSAKVTDDKGNETGTLVPAGTSNADLNAAVGSFANLSTANASLTATVPAPTAKMKVVLPQPTYKTTTVGTPSMKLVEREVDAGDLFSLLRSTTKKFIIEIREREHEALEKIWDFVCTIGDEILTFVIDTVEKVVGAIQSVLQAIGALIKDIIQFVKFLFSWDDIKKTQMVFSNIARIVVNDAIATLKEGRFLDRMNSMIDGVQERLNDWADMDVECPTLNEMSAESTPPSESSSSTDDYLEYHFVNNIGDASQDSSDVGAMEDVLMDLKIAIENQAVIISTALQRFYDEILADFKFLDMSVFEVLKKSMVIITDLVCDSAQNMLDALYNVMMDLVDIIWTFLNKPIRIPILSYILEEFFDYELPCLLDVIILVGAMPATMGYKLINQKAPFPADDPNTQRLLDATTAQQVSNIMSGSATAQKSTAMAKAASEPTETQVTFFSVARSITAVNNGLSALLVIPTNEPVTERISWFNVANMVNNLICYSFDTAVGWFASPAPVNTEAIKEYSTVINSIYVIEKACFVAFLVDSRFEASKKMSLKAGDAALSFVLGALSAVVTISHVVELINQDQFQDTPVQASLALTHCGVEVCIFANAGLAGLLAIPTGSLTLTNIFIGTSAVTSCISGVLRGSEMMVACLAD